MEDTKDIQTQVKEIPAFTVLKNGSILKNIFLLRQQSADAKSSPNQEPDEQILLVGRHPNCHITLEHPSISRHHLSIHSNPSSHTISVVDLSSVHGTWVSGRRIEPGVHVILKEEDTVKIGGSSRVYELHWVPLNQAYDGQFVPTICTIKEGEEEGTHQDERHDEYTSDDDVEGSDVSLSNTIHDSPLRTLNPLTSSVPNCFSSDTVEEHSQPLRAVDENDESVSIQAPLVGLETTSPTDDSDSLDSSEDLLMSLRDNLIKKDLVYLPNFTESSCDDTVEEHSQSLKTVNENDDSVSVQAPLIAEETTSPTDDSDSLNISEDQLNPLRDNLIKEDLVSLPNFSESSCDDTEVEHPSSWKAGNQSGEVLTTISIQGPVIVSEAISETEISDCLKKSEDELNWSRDNWRSAFDHNSHETIEDDLVSIDLFSAIKTHEKDELERSNQTDTDNENELENQQKNTGSVPFVVFDGVNTDVGCEFEQMNNTKMMDESGYMVPFDGIDMSVKSELVDHEILQEDLVFVFPEVMDMGQEKMSTPDISKDNEMHMNLQSVQNVSALKNLLNSVDGKELEFYTPDKENKNPNACSVKSLSKKAVSPVHGEKDSFIFSQKLFATDERMNRELSATDEGINIENTVDPFMNSEEVLAGEKEILGSSQKLFATDEGMNRELSATDEGMDRDLSATDEAINIENKVDSFMNSVEVLASSLEKENESRQMIMEGSCNSVVFPQTVKKAIISSQNLAKKRWTMVVDTNSLLDHKSLKHLNLLEGIKGTQLFVPKIEPSSAVRELMDIKSQDSFFQRSSKKVSLALKWIDECMINTRCRIHEDAETVLSSTAVPEVLEIALRLRKEHTDQKIIILSNNLALRIKAMAEGIMCEAAEEFHESLVNPFSKRFMWVGSSARGLTWSCVDDNHDIVRRKYHGSGSNGSHGLKGLKLLARVNQVTY